MPRLVIVGAGISGLAAARTAADLAAETGREIEVIVLERDARVGGKAQTIHDGPWLVEGGPTAYLNSEPTIDELAEKAGVGDERCEADDAAAHRFVVRGGRMREIPLNPLKFATAGILGPLGLMRILREPWIKPRPAGEDESVWAFARRRLGRQSADRLIAPMVLGVFAGDAKKLSLPAAFPRMTALEQEHGSLIRGLIRRKRQGKGGGPGGPAGKLVSFRTGLHTLTDALAADPRIETRCGASVEAIRRDGDGTSWSVHVEGDGEAIPADAVILAGEAWAMKELIRDEAPDLAGLLGEIFYPPVSVIGLGFDRAGLDKVPRGFGVLIPRGEGFRMLGCLWDSHIFPGRAPDDHLLVRAMVGGAVDTESGALDEAALVELVRDDVRRLFGLDAAPKFTRVVRWPRAIPQYELGHLDKVAAIRAELERRPGLYMAGNALTGIAYGKAAAAGVEAGRAAAERVLEAASGSG